MKGRYIECESVCCYLLMKVTTTDLGVVLKPPIGMHTVEGIEWDERGW